MRGLKGKMKLRQMKKINNDNNNALATQSYGASRNNIISFLSTLGSDHNLLRV